MRFYVVCIGKLKDAYLREGVAEFVKRMRPYGGITITELNESKIGDKPSDADRKQVVAEEGDRLLKGVPKNAYTVLLDVYGKPMSSEELAKTVSKLEVDGVSDMAFIIGGAFGVSDTLRQTVNYKLSFSPMTFTHQMVRLLLVEQIYRASKINRNEPVGKDAPISDVADLLVKYNLTAVSVVDDDNKLLGIISEGDLLYKKVRPHVPHYVNVLGASIYYNGIGEYNAQFKKLLASHVHELMTDEVITTTPDKDVEEIVSVMLDQHLKNVPVVDKEYRLIGILSRRDIIKLIAKDN